MALFKESFNISITAPGIGTWDNLIGINSNFVNNSADTGGAVEFYYDNDVEMINSNFVNNSADRGGALDVYYNNHDVQIINCSFINNDSNKGGAVERRQVRQVKRVRLWP